MKKHVFIIACSCFVSFVGLVVDVLFGLAEETVSEGSSDPFYDFLKPFWTKIIRPIPYYLFELLPDGDHKYFYFTLIGIFYWLVIGFVLSVLVCFTWSKLGKKGR